MWRKPPRVVLFLPEFWGFYKFLVYETARAEHPDDGIIHPAENRSFTIINYALIALTAT